MTVPTQAQLERIRARPHRTKLWLGIYQPKTIAVAKIGSGHSKGDVTLTVTWDSGDYSMIRDGMTAYIGSSSGAVDKGRIRVREAGATTIKVAESAHSWQENWYLTIVEYFEPWSVFPRITLDANNVPIFYKDYDIEYTNQNQVLDPVVNMGPHHAGFLETGTHSVWYTHSGSFDPTVGGAAITGSLFEWYFGDPGFVEPTGTTDQEPGWVHYHSGGHYTTRLTVTTPAGKSFTGYRHIQIYDRPGEGPTRPFVEWGLNDLEGSRDDGGYAASFWVREEAGYSQIKDGALVVVFSDDWQGSESGAIGGNAENRESVLFVGYIDTNSIEIDPITNRVEFEASSITRTMEELSNYSASIESKENAMTWYQLRKMTVDRAIIHLLRWHSTVLAVADFSPTEDTRQIQYADFDRGSLYETADGFLESTLGARMVSDRQGKIWTEISLNLITTGSSRSGFQTALSTERRDWRDSISINAYPHSRLAYAELGGISYDGPETGTIGAYLTGAPGNAQLYRGSVERISGLVVLNQDSLNVFAGHYLARENAEFPEVEVPLAGDYRFIDIAPQERVALSIDEEDNYRGYVWDEKKFLPQRITYTYEAEAQSLFVDLSLYEETEGTEAGDTIEIPEDPPYNTPDLPPWEWEFPPIIPFDPPEIPVEAPPTYGSLVYVAYTTRLIRCRNVWDAKPNWEDLGAPSAINANMTTILAFRLDPTDPLNTAYVAGLGAGGIPVICKTQSLNADTPVWTKVLTESTADLFLGGTPRILNIKVWLNGGAIFAGAAGEYGCGIGKKCLKLIRSLDGGASWESFQIDPGNNEIVGQVISTFYGTGIVYAGSRFKRWKSVNLGAAWIPQESPGVASRPVDCVAVLDPSGATTMWRTQSGGNDSTGISTDDGATMTRYLQIHRGHYLTPVKSHSANYFGYAGDNSYNVMVHPVSGVIFGLLISKSFGIWTGGSWTILYDFPDTDQYGPYHGHYGDDSFHYVMGPNSVSAPWLAASDDGGYTWYDITGDFVSAIGAKSSYPNAIAIEPVHNV